MKSPYRIALVLIVLTMMLSCQKAKVTDEKEDTAVGSGAILDREPATETITYKVKNVDDVSQPNMLAMETVVVKEAPFKGLIRTVHSLNEGDKIIYRVGHSVNNLSIHLTDFSSGKTAQLAGPGSWTPIPSPDEKFIAYNQIDMKAYEKIMTYYPFQEIKNDVHIMDVNGERKIPLSNDGQSLLIGWNEDSKEVYISKGPFDEATYVFIYQTEKLGYWAINLENKNIRKLSGDPLEDKNIVLKETKSDIVKYNYSNIIYDLYFKGDKIFSTTDFGTESEWFWRPNIFTLNDNSLLVTEFKPHEYSEQPFFGGDGHCNIVEIKISDRVEKENVVEDITCDQSYLTLSPDKEIISFHEPGKTILMSMSTKRTVAIKDLVGKRVDPSIKWSKDSRYIYARNNGKIYRINVENLFAQD